MLATSINADVRRCRQRQADPRAFLHTPSVGDANSRKPWPNCKPTVVGRFRSGSQKDLIILGSAIKAARAFFQIQRYDRCDRIFVKKANQLQPTDDGRSPLLTGEPEGWDILNAEKWSAKQH